MLIANRGISDVYPENSRGAFLDARAKGYPAVEVDVKRSLDGCFYLFHDRNSERLLAMDIDLTTRTLDELVRYPLYWQGVETNERILSLENFLREFSTDFIVYLDIKRHGVRNVHQLTSQMMDVVTRYDRHSRVIVGGDFLFTAWFEFRFPDWITVHGSRGDRRARAYRWIPRRFRPDLLLSRFDEITPAQIWWLMNTDSRKRWIVRVEGPGERDDALSWGINRILVD